jgi:hypothetical protein
MFITKELEKILKKYPRGYHSVSKKEMYEILDAYEYQMMSPGYYSGWFGVARETLRQWGKKKIIHYFAVKDRLFGGLEVYIPMHTFLDAKLPSMEPYEKQINQIRQQMKDFAERHQQRIEMQRLGEEQKQKGEGFYSKENIEMRRARKEQLQKELGEWKKKGEKERGEFPDDLP